MNFLGPQNNFKCLLAIDETVPLAAAEISAL